MIIGNGLVANGFKQYDSDDIVIFASGVSHSAGNNAAEFLREAGLLKNIINQYPQKKLAYFSTCSVYDPAMQSSPYVLHKLAMENMLREEHKHFYIFRVSNLAGKTANPHTVLNFIFLHISGNIPFLLWKNAYRNIIDIEDAAMICHDILQTSQFEKHPHKHCKS